MKFICNICDYVYDEKKGEPHWGVKEGTSYEALGPDWKCPVCDSDKTNFSELQAEEPEDGRK